MALLLPTLKYAAAAATVGSGLIGYGRYSKESASKQFPWFSVSPTLEKPLKMYESIKDLNTRVQMPWPTLCARAKETESTLKPVSVYQSQADWLKSARGSWGIDIMAVVALVFVFSGSSIVIKLLALLSSYMAVFLPRMKEMNILLYMMFILYIGGVLMLLFFIMSIF